MSLDISKHAQCAAIGEVKNWPWLRTTLLDFSISVPCKLFRLTIISHSNILSSLCILFLFFILCVCDINIHLDTEAIRFELIMEATRPTHHVTQLSSHFWAISEIHTSPWSPSFCPHVLSAQVLTVPSPEYCLSTIVCLSWPPPLFPSVRPPQCCLWLLSKAVMILTLPDSASIGSF